LADLLPVPALRLAHNCFPVLRPLRAARPDAMAHLNILRYPDPRLHTVAKPVATVDDRIRRLVDDMLETMYAAEGVGLAATQVDVHERVIVMDTSEARDQPTVLINPQITWRSNEMRLAEEGCLSVPTIYDKVERHASVKVQALGRDGQVYEMHAEELAAVCVQHEMDHLLGKVFKKAREER
jgi:peptide deformylase